MSKKKKTATVATQTLSTLVFCLGAGSAAHAAQPAVNIQALELLQENKISLDDFHKIVSSSPTEFLNASNFSDFVNEGNFANFLNASNFADFVNEGNFANFINAGNFGEQPTDEKEASLPSPQVSL